MCFLGEENFSSRELCRKILQRERERKWNPRKCCQNNLSSGITRKRGKSRQLLTAQRRDTETPGSLLLPSHSGPSSWNMRTQRAVFWIRTLLITKEPADREGGFKGGKREMGRAKRGPGKDSCQLFLQSLHLRLLGASLHPALPPCSSAAAQGLLQQRKTPLMVQTERSVCVLRTESLSLDCPWIHVTSALPSLFLCSRCLLPNDFVSLHPSFFLSFQTSSVHLGLPLSLRSLWASLQVYF